MINDVKSFLTTHFHWFVYLVAGAALTNCRKPGSLKQRMFILSNCQVQNQCHWRMSKGLFLPEAPGDEPPCMFQLLETCCLCVPWLLAPSSITKAGGFRDHIAFCLCGQVSFALPFKGHLWWHLVPALIIQDNFSSQDPNPICKLPFVI